MEIARTGATLLSFPAAGKWAANSAGMKGRARPRATDTAENFILYTTRICVKETKMRRVLGAFDGFTD